MTVEWMDICDRCSGPHDADPAGLRIPQPCTDRVELLSLLRRRPSFCEVRLLGAGGKRLMTRHFMRETLAFTFPGTNPPMPLESAEVVVSNGTQAARITTGHQSVVLTLGDTLTFTIPPDVRDVIARIHKRADEIGFGPAIVEAMSVTVA